MMKRTLILISCLAALLVDAQSLVYTPAMPVLDVPFLVTPAVSSGTSVYLSKTESCDASSSLVSLCTIGSSSSVNYNSTTCVYTITSEDLGLTAKYARDEDVPTLYWCKSGSTTYFAKFDISKVSTVSPIVPFGKASTVVFNKATPEGTQVGFYASSSCTNLVTGTSLSFLDSTRSADVTISSGNVAYVCATVANPLGGTVFIPAGALVVAVSYTINGNKGHRYMNMDVSGNAMYPYFSLSLSPDCYPLAQDPQVWSTTNPKLFIQVPKGKYYFCGYSLLTDTGSSDKFGAYIPATDQVEVTEYGLQPHSVYSGMPTTMTFTMDSVSSGVTFEAALFSDTACKTSVVSWSSTPAWNIPTVGTYYACVRRAGTTDSTARSATIIVSRQPTITYSRTPAVRGLALGLTLDRFLSVGVITGGLSDGSACTTLIASGKTTQSGNTLGLQVPLTAGGSVYTCLSTPVKESAEENALKAVPEYEIDRGYSYSFGTFSTRAYALTYAPLRVNTDLAIGLDPDVTFSAGSKMRVQGLGVECSAALESGNNEFSLSPSTTSITPVNFPQKGQWKLCVSEPGVLNGDYVVLRNFVVYGDAEFAPKGLLTGLSTAMTITDIPADAAFYFLDGSRTCSTTGADSNKLFAGVSSTDGTGSVTMLQSKSGQLTACVAYRGMNGDTPTDPVTYAAGEITVTAPTVYPNVVIGGQTTNLNFQVPDASLLKDGIAYLAASATSCASSPPAGALQLVITASSDDALPFVVFSPTTSMIGTTYLVCVGKTGSYVSAGNVRVMQALEFSVTNGAAATNTATSITFTGTTFSQMAPDRFMVLPDGGDCVSGTAASDVRASGSISTTGITDVFLAPEVSTATKYTVCVANSQHMLSNTTGFTYAGQITVYDFTVLSTFAQLDRVNDLKAWPIGTGTSIYITPCSGTSCSAASADSTCRVATSKYYTSPLLVLTGAPRGTYLVCQQSENPASVVGSNATITVIDPFTLDLGGVDHVKQYVPFDVTLGGGNIPTRMLRSAGTTDYKLRVQPATTTCDETPTESQTFDIIGGANTFTITDKVSPRKDIIFCLVASSKDTINVGKSLLEFYMSPSAIVTDEATVITSSASTTGVVAKVASTASCADTISSGSGAALNTNKQSTQTIVGCSTTNANVKTAYYCESTDGGSSYANRGKMILLRRVGCPGGASASITAVTTAPATAIANFGIDTTALVDPQLSKSSTCADLLSTKVNTNGYVPRYDESAVFYVCARSTSDSTYLFTTTTPTLTVEKYTGTPTSVLSRLNTTIGRVTNTSVTLNYPTPSVQTFFSASTGCSPVISSASGSGFAGSTMKGWYSATAVQNLVYVCTADTETGTQRPIVSLLSVSTPSVSGMSPAIIKGAHFTATLRINALLAGSPLYSMVPGADASYPYADYYVSEDRSVFFSTDACTTTLTGTSAATVGSDGMVSFETSAVNVNVLKSVSLCTGTPAGVGVAVDVPVTNGPIYPTSYITGARNPTYLPLNPDTTFSLSYSAGDCSALSATLPNFVTDANGYSTIDLTGSDGVPAALGTYTLCYAGTNRAASTPLTTIEVIQGTYYDTLGNTFIVGVPGPVTLLKDLTSGVLLEGFSTSQSCSSTTTAYGTWTSLPASSVSVTATAPISTIYLCAAVPSNNTVVALPLKGSFVFATSSIAIPFNQFDTCNSFTISRCVAPGYSLGTGAILGIVHGSCCDPAAQANHLGATSMDSGDSCELHPDDSRVRQYPSGTKFSVCGWSVSDPNYCVTFGTTNVSYSCTGDNARGAGGSSGLSKGALIAIIICSIIAGLLLIALIIFLIWYCCCREEESDVKDKKMVALRHLENPDGEFGFDGVVGSMRHPLMYYPGDMEMMPNSLRSYSLAPSSRFDNIVENMESDERDQFCLEEARQRYQLRLLFNEQTELMRIAEKENDLNVTFDNDDLLPRGNAVPEMRPLEIDLDDPNTTAMTDHDMIPNDSLVECPGERVLQSSAPSTPSHQSSFSDDGVVDIDTVPERQYSPEHQPDTTIDQSPIKQNSSLPMPTFVSLPERSVSPQFGHQRTPSDENELSTTTTQRYHDEKRFLLAQEETRRTRLHNWEEEERATLMANELTARQGGKALTPLESPQTRIAAPPSRPRRSGRGSLADPSSSKGTEDEEDIHYYDAPRQPAKMPPLPARPNNNNNNNKNDSEDMLAQILGVRFDGSAEL